MPLTGSTGVVSHPLWKSDPYKYWHTSTAQILVSQQLRAHISPVLAGTGIQYLESTDASVLVKRYHPRIMPVHISVVIASTAPVSRNTGVVSHPLWKPDPYKYWHTSTAQILVSQQLRARISPGLAGTGMHYLESTGASVLVKRYHPRIMPVHVSVVIASTAPVSRNTGVVLLPLLKSDWGCRFSDSYGIFTICTSISCVKVSNTIHYFNKYFTSFGKMEKPHSFVFLSDRQTAKCAEKFFAFLYSRRKFHLETFINFLLINDCYCSVM